jgi:flagellar FliJ protein
MAKQFQFRFETMLKLRRRREDEHKRIVADRLRQIAQVREQIASQEEQIQQQTDVIRGHTAAGTIDLQQVMRNRHWLGHLHKGILEAQARIRFLEARLSQERVHLAEAAKQRRVLEKLKERQQERYLQDQNRRATRELDEMATVRFVYERK